MSDPKTKKRVAYTFLEEIKRSFLDTYPFRQINNSVAYGLKGYATEIKSMIVLLI
jgi:hypothetical protein